MEMGIYQLNNLSKYSEKIKLDKILLSYLQILISTMMDRFLISNLRM